MPYPLFDAIERARLSYRNARRFEGGLVAWEDAGYPLEGEWLLE